MPLSPGGQFTLYRKGGFSFRGLAILHYWNYKIFEKHAARREVKRISGIKDA
jgi:hypothetical protein